MRALDDTAYFAFTKVVSYARKLLIKFLHWYIICEEGQTLTYWSTSKATALSLGLQGHVFAVTYDWAVGPHSVCTCQAFTALSNVTLQLIGLIYKLQRK